MKSRSNRKRTTIGLPKRAAVDPLASNTGPALEGSLEVVGLATMLAVFELERRSGVIRLMGGGSEARVLLQEGRPVQARLGEHRGRDALLEILEWRRGMFEFIPGLVDVKDEVRTPISWLLLEAARRQDERQPAADQAAAF